MHGFFWSICFLSLAGLLAGQPSDSVAASANFSRFWVVLCYTRLFLLCLWIWEKEGRWHQATSAICLSWTRVCCPVEYWNTICFQHWDACPLEKRGGTWTDRVPCPLSCDRKVDLFGLSCCACCMVSSVKELTHSYAGPSLLSLTSNVTATQI